MVAFPSVGSTVDIASIAERQRQKVYRWFNAHIQIIDPAQATTTPYDPETDTGGESTPVVLYDSGANGARIQPLRSPNAAVVGEQPLNTRAVEIQTKLDYSAGVLRSGLRIIVVDGGEDKTLENYVYTLQSGVNSSFGWVRTLFCTVDLANPQTTGVDGYVFPDGLLPSGFLMPEAS